MTGWLRPRSLRYDRGSSEPLQTLHVGALYPLLSDLKLIFEVRDEKNDS